jgi:hypothetical protein
MADPATFPCVGRTLMSGALPHGCTFGAAEPLDNAPGVGIPATHQVGFSVLSRVGCVRVNKS